MYGKFVNFYNNYGKSHKKIVYINLQCKNSYINIVCLLNFLFMNFVGELKNKFIPKHGFRIIISNA